MEAVAGAAFFGAFLQELLYWNGLKRHLADAGVLKIIRSPGYWFITVLMLVSAPIVTILMHFDDPHQMLLRDAMVYGAATPAILKQTFGSAAPNPPRRTAVAGSGLPRGALGFMSGPPTLSSGSSFYFRAYYSRFFQSILKYLRVV